MIPSDDAMTFLEGHIPELAESALTQAYWQALAAGHSVLESVDGDVFEVFPDGTRRLVKSNPPPVPMTPGASRSRA
ncbi:MAG: hypothetical protein RL318_2580 [Fibrobacterota bacterium]|jgi:hypothetical protein